MSYPFLVERINQSKPLLRRIYGKLPFEVGVLLARGRPNWAFYIGERQKRLVMEGFLGQFRVNIDTSSDIERRMLSGQYEPLVHALIDRYVPPGGVCFDVGANVGAHTFAMAARVGPTGRVHAFEPGPPYVRRLRDNVGLNEWVAARIVIHEVGLSDRAGSAAWQASNRDPGTGTIQWVDPTLPSTTVPTTTLDEQAAALGLERLDFIKTDVDGMDHLVVQGGIETIQRFRPVLVIETLLADAEQIQGTDAALAKLRALGYSLYRLEPQGDVVPATFPNLTPDTLALPNQS